jgi:apolipoprotein D and lipocalin family protein
VRALDIEESITMKNPLNVRRARRGVSCVLVAGSLLAMPATTDATTAPDPRPVQTVRAVDLNRYQGRWLNLASIPSPFLDACERDITADYEILPDGLVKVVNTCTAGGIPIPIEGRARVVDAATNSKLQVTFAQQNGQFFFVPGGDYWIIGLDRDYRWAVVGDPDRSGGFILSRTPTLAPRDLVRIVIALVRSGYDPCRFELTPTTGGLEATGSICAPQFASRSDAGRVTR